MQLTGVIKSDELKERCSDLAEAMDVAPPPPASAGEASVGTPAQQTLDEEADFYGV
jgi:hypothetical protein